MNDNVVYFMFSVTQMNNSEKINKTIGKKYKPGTVLVNGSYKQFTEIVNRLEDVKYPDAILVASGVLSEMRYSR